MQLITDYKDLHHTCDFNIIPVHTVHFPISSAHCSAHWADFISWWSVCLCCCFHWWYLVDEGFLKSEHKIIVFSGNKYWEQNSLASGDTNQRELCQHWTSFRSAYICIAITLILFWVSYHSGEVGYFFTHCVKQSSAMHTCLTITTWACLNSHRPLRQHAKHRLLWFYSSTVEHWGPTAEGAAPPPLSVAGYLWSKHMQVNAYISVCLLGLGAHL